MCAKSSARLVDGSEFAEFKARYGTTLVCGFAHIHGYPVGINRQQRHPVLGSRRSRAPTSSSCCNQRNIPLVFLQNITGFMVGKKYEQAGIAKDGAKMVTAVACSHVPKFTVIIGGSFGAGNYAMCGRGLSAAIPCGPGRTRAFRSWAANRPPASWPRSSATRCRHAARTGRKTKRKVSKAPIRDQVRKTQGHPYYATARLWDDGVIDPVDTRRVLGLALATSANAPIKRDNYGVFRM